MKSRICALDARRGVGQNQTPTRQAERNRFNKRGRGTFREMQQHEYSSVLYSNPSHPQPHPKPVEWISLPSRQKDGKQYGRIISRSFC